ncbi:MAG: excalibur calcium-binding domain-containing protein [Actinomycetota bacterium]|nr:excalibur calcium-binding domain-containing protein [Actinomycetota bacterium]
MPPTRLGSPQRCPSASTGASPAHDTRFGSSKVADAVHAAGRAPLFRGQAGYRAGLDRDNDGVACE